MFVSLQKIFQAAGLRGLYGQFMCFVMAGALPFITCVSAFSTVTDAWRTLLMVFLLSTCLGLIWAMAYLRDYHDWRESYLELLGLGKSEVLLVSAILFIPFDIFFSTILLIPLLKSNLPVMLFIVIGLYTIAISIVFIGVLRPLQNRSGRGCSKLVNQILLQKTLRSALVAKDLSGMSVFATVLAMLIILLLCFVATLIGVATPLACYVLMAWVGVGCATDCIKCETKSSFQNIIINYGLNEKSLLESKTIISTFCSLIVGYIFIFMAKMAEKANLIDFLVPLGVCSFLYLAISSFSRGYYRSLGHGNELFFWVHLEWGFPYLHHFLSLLRS